MENTYQNFDPHRWQLNGVDPSADPSIYSRQQAPLLLGGFGAYAHCT
jgi:hypothetical protein